MEINYICSLGSWCLPAVYMAEHNLRKCAYPFDYIISSPEMVVDCLRDDFQLFLDKSRYEECGEGEHISSNHKLYGKFSHSLTLDKHRILDNTFRHHNVTKDNDYEAFIRKIDRFRLLLSKKEPKLFLLFSQHEEFTKKQIEELDKMLKMKTTNYEVLCITIQQGESTHHTIEILNNIKIVKLYTDSSYREWLTPPGDIYINEIISTYYKLELKDDIKLENGSI